MSWNDSNNVTRHTKCSKCFDAVLTTQVLAVAVSFNCIILVALKFAVKMASLFYYKARYIYVCICATCCTPPIVQIQHY